MSSECTTPPVTLGIAALSRKLHSRPMQAILSRLQAADPNMAILSFDEDVMSRPIHLWPKVDVLLTLYSTNFPLTKVLGYTALRSPLLVNNVHMQPLMQDRRLIRRVLARAGVPTPPAIYVDRSAGDTVSQSGDCNTLQVTNVARSTSYTIQKPFVEKPVDPDDHNVYIYYRDGGVRKLFRKVKNQSSCYDGCETQVRETGDYIYEAFYEPRECADIKVYAVGPDYFHAEARKAPHVDGIVERDSAGLERRNHVELTALETGMCRRVVNAFDQFVLGFDLLRSNGDLRFVIDVNGWSLVKNSTQYADVCATRLAKHVRMRLHERRSLHVRAPHLAHSDSEKAALEAAVEESGADQFDNSAMAVATAAVVESPLPCAV